jgi:hypothetical protein
MISALLDDVDDLLDGLVGIGQFTAGRVALLRHDRHIAQILPHNLGERRFQEASRYCRRVAGNRTNAISAKLTVIAHTQVQLHVPNTYGMASGARK